MYTILHIATEVLEALHPGATGLCFNIQVWLVILIGLTNSLRTSTFSKMIKSMYSSLTSHTLRREEGSGYAATIEELSPRQKLDVTNQIHTLCRSHPLSWSTIMSCVKRMSASYLTAVFDNCVPHRQLNGCSMTRPFLSLRRVWHVRQHVFLIKEVNSLVSKNLILTSFLL